MLAICLEVLFALVFVVAVIGLLAFTVFVLRMSLLMLPVLLMPTKEMIRRSNETEARRRASSLTTHAGRTSAFEDDEYDARRHL